MYRVRGFGSCAQCGVIISFLKDMMLPGGIKGYLADTTKIYKHATTTAIYHGAILATHTADRKSPTHQTHTNHDASHSMCIHAGRWH